MKTVLLININETNTESPLTISKLNIKQDVNSEGIDIIEAIDIKDFKSEVLALSKALTALMLITTEETDITIVDLYNTVIDDIAISLQDSDFIVEKYNDEDSYFINNITDDETN